MRCFFTLLILSSLAGSLAAQKQVSLPDKVDLVPDFAKLEMAPVDQGKRDTCSLFAVTALAEFELGQHTKEPRKRLSEEFLIWAAHDATGKRAIRPCFTRRCMD